MRLLVSLLFVSTLAAAVVGSVRGIVHDPDHRPVADATLTIKSSTSDFSQTLMTAADGSFEVTALPVGAYRVTVSREGFAPAEQQVVVTSGAAPVLHFQLVLSSRNEQVTVSESALTADPERVTPTSVISRAE